jgi:hypothetical protein
MVCKIIHEVKGEQNESKLARTRNNINFGQIMQKPVAGTTSEQFGSTDSEHFIKIQICTTPTSKTMFELLLFLI